MKINLAGYNVDADALELAVTDLQDDELRGGTVASLTPETISAAYARISRAEDSVDKLREQSCRELQKARKSNHTIVFEYGHASVAEHAVLNFDIIDVSRLIIEVIEHARLCSYTEKSQRYLKLKGLEEVHMPEELHGNRGEFKKVAEAQMEAYHAIHALIEADAEESARMSDKDGGSTALKAKNASNTKEDARYVTCLAVVGQLGMTINARNLELMVRRLYAHPLKEAHRIATELLKASEPVIPSLLRRAEQPEFVRQPWRFKLPKLEVPVPMEKQVNVINAGLFESDGSNPDALVLAALVHQTSNAPFDLCDTVVRQMNQEQRWKAFWSIYEGLEMHDAVPRQWELPDITVELTGSASFFAQLKRHRMATLLTQAYDLSLGVTIPESIQRVPAALDMFERVREQTEEVHCNLKDHPYAADYILMQAHRRRVLVKMNARELYAFARLRQDCHAQWEIRQVAHELIDAVSSSMPMTLALACGKDLFDQTKETLTGVAENFRKARLNEGGLARKKMPLAMKIAR
jgi:thymidylate synthase ThyX